jgi:hypothetical protein
VSRELLSAYDTPSFCVLVGVPRKQRRQGFIEQREVKAGDVHQLELCILAFFGDAINPIGNSFG